MPPRLPLRTLAQITNPAVSSISISSFLVPFLQYFPQRHVPQFRCASILSSLSNIPSSYKKKIRRGRGPSSGKGQKSGRGTHGQKARGKVPAHFTGGQTKEEIVHGHYGFKNIHTIEMSPVNLDTIQSWINSGRLNPSRPITLRELAATRAIHGVKDGVKLLARGSTSLTTAVHIVVSRASRTAIAAVEALGGTVTTRYYTPLAIRRIRMGQMHPYVSLKWEQDKLNNKVLTVKGAETPEQRVKGVGYQYRLPDPIGRKELEYYRDKANNGYLAHTVAEGASPSLFYASEFEIEQGRRLKAARKAEMEKMGASRGSGLGEANKLW